MAGPRLVMNLETGPCRDCSVAIQQLRCLFLRNTHREKKLLLYKYFVSSFQRHLNTLLLQKCPQERVKHPSWGQAQGTGKHLRSPQLLSQGCPGIMSFSYGCSATVPYGIHYHLSFHCTGFINMLCIVFPISKDIERKESFAFRVEISCSAPLNREKTSKQTKKALLDFSLKKKKRK